jgi:acetyltransferase EpsM
VGRAAAAPQSILRGSVARLILIGGGEHARVVAEAARAMGRAELVGFVDSEPCAETVRRLGLRRLGDDAALDEHPGAWGVLCIAAHGSLAARRQIVARLSSKLGGWATVIHPSAWISPTASVEPGAVIMAGAVLQSGARVGAHCVVNSGAIVEHDVELGAFSHAGPRVVLGGGARVGEGAYIGMGAAVRDHVAIGAEALVGMGAVVVGNVETGRRVLGVPAR